MRTRWPREEERRADEVDSALSLTDDRLCSTLSSLARPHQDAAQHPRPPTRSRHRPSPRSLLVLLDLPHLASHSSPQDLHRRRPRSMVPQRGLRPPPGYHPPPHRRRRRPSQRPRLLRVRGASRSPLLLSLPAQLTHVYLAGHLDPRPVPAAREGPHRPGPAPDEPAALRQQGLPGLAPRRRAGASPLANALSVAERS